MAKSNNGGGVFLMKKYSRFVGGVLLISGTSIGAGMLALPVITAFGGFIPSFLVFTFVWGLMFISANFFLDVNLKVRGEPNFISMAERTLGRWGKIVSWCLYLLLLYSLLAAYLAACAPLFSLAFESVFHFALSPIIASFFLPICFGGCLYFGTRGIDYFNRILMAGLIGSYFLIVGIVPQHIELSRLLHLDFSASLLAVPIIITSFGYHIIIPSLTTYMDHDEKLLRKTILVGSIIPFIVYVLWQCIVLGAVPFPSLVVAWNEGAPASEPLAGSLGVSWIGSTVRFFSFFAVITSFLGISLSLSDFLRDGLKLKKSWEGKLMAIALTFLPPLVFVFSYQKGFYAALEYGGAFVAILLGIIPSLMVLRIKTHSWYRNFWGKVFVYIVIFLFTLIAFSNVAVKLGWFQKYITPYL